MRKWTSWIASIEGKVLALLAIGFVLLLGNVAISTWLSSQSQEFADLTLSEHRLKTAVLELRSGLQDAETGQRGFLLTGEQGYLDPYRSALQRVPQLLEEVRQLGSDDAFVSKTTVQITDIAAQRMELARRTVDLAVAGNRDEALELVRSGQGKRWMDQLRGLISELLTHQDREIERRVASLRDMSAWSDFTNVASLLLIVLLAIVSAMLVNRYLKEVEEARSNLADLNQGLEQVIRERSGEIMRANEEIQQFAYIVSHDLRAPLVNIMGFTSELESIGEAMKRQLDEFAKAAPERVVQESREALDDELPEAISFIRASTAKMDRLINAILKLSREGRRVLTPTRVNMGELAENIAASLKHQTDESDAEIEVGDLPDLTTDRLAIEQILGNLVENAVKYLEKGRKGLITISGRQDGPYNEYRIKDNGRGIDTSDRERVFELFRRAGRQDTKGEGLGLAFVRAIVRRLGGSIDLESEPGVGTTFILRLPRVLAQSRSTS